MIARYEDPRRPLFVAANSEVSQLTPRTFAAEHDVLWLVIPNPVEQRDLSQLEHGVIDHCDEATPCFVYVQKPRWAFVDQMFNVVGVLRMRFSRVTIVFRSDVYTSCQRLIDERMRIDRIGPEMVLVGFEELQEALARKGAVNGN